MTPKLSHILIGAALAIGLIGAIAFGVSHFASKVEAKAETQSHVDQGQALAHAQAAKELDAAVQDIKAKLVLAQANLDRITSERNALLRKLKQPVSSGPVALPNLPAIPPGDPDVRDAVIAKDAEVIDAQAKVIEGQKVEITGLGASRDQWKATYEAESRRVAGLEIALAAQKHVSASGKWIGRLQGFAVGIGTGYVAGRLH